MKFLPSIILFQAVFLLSPGFAAILPATAIASPGFTANPETVAQTLIAVDVQGTMFSTLTGATVATATNAGQRFGTISEGTPANDAEALTGLAFTRGRVNVEDLDYTLGTTINLGDPVRIFMGEISTLNQDGDAVRIEPLSGGLPIAGWFLNIVSTNYGPQSGLWDPSGGLPDIAGRLTTFALSDFSGGAPGTLVNVDGIRVIDDVGAVDYDPNVCGTMVLPGVGVEGVFISEFMADNSGGLLDEDGDASDWIEICNLGTNRVNLAGHALTDDPANLSKWLFPPLELQGQSCVIVFASNKGRDDPLEELHTNFRLDKDGEYLALVALDSATVLHAYEPTYPQQFADISYGFGTAALSDSLLGSITAFVPSSDALSNTWLQVGFDDSGWLSGPPGVGFDTGTTFDSLIGLDLEAAMQGVNPGAYLRFPFSVVDASDVHSLTLDLRYDDGFIAYLNGQEVLRRNALPEINGEDRMAGYTTRVRNGGTELLSVTLDRGGRRHVYSTNDLIGITLTGFKAGGVNNCIGLTTNVPVAGERHRFIDDDFFLNTGAINPGGNTTAPTSDPVIDGTPGMAIVFDQPVTNSAGDDVVLFELHNSGTHGDAFQVMPLTGLTGGSRRSQQISQYDVPMADAAPLQAFQQFTYNPAPQSLILFENQALSIGSRSTGFSAPATGIDLNDLGVPPGGTVTGLFIRAVASGGGIDPVFIAGLPPASASGNGWASPAKSDRANSLALVPESIDLTHDRDVIQTGDNLLAIHGFSKGLEDPDFLIQPSLLKESRYFDTNVVQYFYADTPGLPNEDGQTVLGPYILDATDAWAEPSGTFSLTVTAEVAETSFPIQRVEVFYRLMYTGEVSVAMFDDGVAPDVFAGDGLYTASFSGAILPGHMLRWRFEAEDSQGARSDWPNYSADPNDRDRYFGIMATDPSIETLLPVVHWFIENPNAANNKNPGTKASVYFLGRFYDNVQSDLHGQSSAGNQFPKKSYDLDFNRGNRFVWQEGEGKVKDINLITNWADKSKARNTLGYETIRRSGAPGHFSFPVRVQMNGAFFSVADMIEDGDDDFLDRVGLDGQGALYKMYNSLNTAASGAEKKSRKDEDNSDLATFISGLTTGSGAEQIRFVYDHVDLAQCANYYAVQSVYGNHDFGHKNYYIYRDTRGSGEWFPVSWDADLSFGHKWNSTDRYLDDRLLFNNSVNIGSGGNRLRQDLYAHGPFYQMFTRRLRTLLDEMLNLPGTAVSNQFYETRLDEIADLIDPPGITPSDADLDYAKWGGWGDMTEMRDYMQRLKDEFFEQRRRFLYITNSLNSGLIPDAQPAFCPIQIDTIDFLPAGGHQDEEFIRLVNTNDFAVDLSGWMITGAVDHVFTPGTVLPAFNASVADESRMYIVRDRPGFRARALSPTANELRFVQGDYQGQLSARGETVFLVNAETNLVDTMSYAGTPTELQQSLRVTELNYHPSDPTVAESLGLPGVGNKDFEYIELMNIGLNPIDLSQASFVEGVLYTFPSNTLLAAGERQVVVHNLPAFELRYGTNETVSGNFSGNLDNKSERLRLQDAVGENILTFTYDEDWEPATDGAGGALTIIDPEADYQTWGVSNAWRNSGKLNGSPGWDDADLADLDRDGMADSWELAQLGSTNALPGTDGDLDRMSNLEEYLAGTLPLASDHFLAVEVVFEHGVQQVRLETLPATGTGYTRLERRYTLESAEELQLPFTPVSGMENLLGQGQTLIHVHQDGSPRYYRGRVALR